MSEPDPDADEDAAETEEQEEAEQEADHSEGPLTAERAEALIPKEIG